jgi:hypothetical protein
MSSLEQIAGQLNQEAAGPKAEMLLSSVQDHCISSQRVVNHPRLATLISTESLPLCVLEDLFESRKCNPSFKKDMETHIHSYFAASPLY